MQGGGGGGFFNLTPPNQNPSFISPTPQGFFLHGYDHHNNYSSFTSFSLQNPIMPAATPQLSSAPSPYDYFWDLSKTLSSNALVSMTGSEIISPPCPTMHDINFADGLLLDEEGGSREREQPRTETSKKNKNKKGRRVKPAVSTEKKSMGKKQPLIKGQWTQEEDRLLSYLVDVHGPKKWTKIARSLKGRAGKQCRERWNNHLREGIKTDPWNEEEEEMLVEAHKVHGNKWAKIAEIIPGRTENNIKNYWNTTFRKLRNRSTKRTRRILFKPPTFLEAYMISIDDQDLNVIPTRALLPSPSSSSVSSSTSTLSDPQSQATVNDGQKVLETSGSFSEYSQSLSVPLSLDERVFMQYPNLINDSSTDPSRPLGSTFWPLDGSNEMHLGQEVVGESSFDQNMMMMMMMNNDPNEGPNYDEQEASYDMMMMLINYRGIP